MAKQKITITVQAVGTRQEMAEKLDEIKADFMNNPKKTSNRHPYASSTDYKWSWTIALHT